MRLEDDTLFASLGDGRRLAIATRQPAAVLATSDGSLTAARAMGTELAERLARSAPRPLSLLYRAGVLDDIDWEHLGRQLLTDSEIATPAVALTESLSVSLILDEVAVRLSEPALSVRELGQEPQRERVASAQVLVLENVSLERLLADASLPVRPRLVVMAGRPGISALCRALDAGALACA